MFIGFISVLAVVSLILRSFLRNSKALASEVSMDDLEEFNAGPPLQSQLLEAESKGLIDIKFPHNHGTPVYNFAELLKIINSYAKKIKTPEHEFNEYQRNHLLNLINIEKMFQILRYLCLKNYETVHIKKGNNSGPRAISVKVFGSQNQHKKVRKEVQENLIQEYTKKDASIDAKQLLKEYKEQCRQNNRFTEQELQAAAYLYDFPIIVLSFKCKMAFFDCLFEAKTAEGNAKTPLYLHYEQG
jgi:hypothetical protein